MLWVGNSHMNCVLNAAQDAGLPFTAITVKKIRNVEHLFGLDQSKLIVDNGKPDFSDATKALISSSPGHVFSYVSGVKHVEYPLRRLDDPSEPPFDFFLPDAPQLPPVATAELIPADAVTALMERAFRSRLKVLRKVTALAPGRVIQFGPPPPVSESWIRSFAAGYGADPALLPTAGLRWKLWHVTVKMFREQAERLGARFVDAPRETMDGDGFLRDDLVRNVTHGNTAYGAILLAHIRPLL